MLFESLKIRGIALKNRIMVSPMCQYSYEGDFSNCSGWTRTDIGGKKRRNLPKKQPKLLFGLPGSWIMDQQADSLEIRNVLPSRG